MTEEQWDELLYIISIIEVERDLWGRDWEKEIGGRGSGISVINPTPTTHIFF